MPTLHEAFSPQPYLQFAELGYDAVVRAALSDFSGLIQESSGIPTIYKMEADASRVTWKVMVPDPKNTQGHSFQAYSADIESHLSNDPTLPAIQKIKQIVSNSKNYIPNDNLHQDTCVYLWMSPPQPEKYAQYKEARVEIGLLTRNTRTNTYSGEILSNIAPTWSQADCATNFDIFRGFHTDSNPDQIRDTPLVLAPPKDQDPLVWFGHLAGLSDLATQYSSGILHDQQKEVMEHIVEETNMFAIAVMALAKTGETNTSATTLLYDSVKRASGGILSSTCFSEGSSSSSESHYYGTPDCPKVKCASCGWELAEGQEMPTSCPSLKTDKITGQLIICGWRPGDPL